MDSVQKRAWRGANPTFLGLIALAGALVWATWLATTSWRTVKERPYERTISVTGSAKKRIASDLIEWSATVEARAMDRTEAYRTLKEHVDKTITFIKAQGVNASDVLPQSASFRQLFDAQVTVIDDERVEREIPAGWMVEQSILIRSKDVATVERASREVTSLLEQGVSVRSGAPAYFYTKLGELKVEMLALAAEDARIRAQNIVTSAGGAALGDLVDADMGVININPANSTNTSWDGNNDTTSLEKDILTIVHVKFSLTAANAPVP